jgi:hypothetical protein
MFSDVTTTNGNNMIVDDDDDDDNNNKNYNDSGDASYRDYMSAMKYNLDEYSIFQSPRTGDALITALLNNPIDHIIISNNTSTTNNNNDDDGDMNNRNDGIGVDKNNGDGSSDINGSSGAVVIDDDDDDDDDDDNDDDFIYSFTKNIDRSILNSIISRIIIDKNKNTNHYLSSIYAILELITPQYSFHPTLICSSKGYCSLFTYIQREIRKVLDRKSSFLMKQIKYDKNYKDMYDNNDFHNDDDVDANAMSNEVMSDKEQLLQLYIIRDNVWKHLKTSIKTYYNNNKDNGEDNNNNNNNIDNSSGNIKRSNDVLNGRVIDSFLRCYQFDMNGAKMIWSKEILPLLKALHQPIDGMDNYNSR